MSTEKENLDQLIAEYSDRWSKNGKWADFQKLNELRAKKESQVEQVVEAPVVAVVETEKPQAAVQPKARTKRAKSTPAK